MRKLRNEAAREIKKYENYEEREKRKVKARNIERERESKCLKRDGQTEKT